MNAWRALIADFRPTPELRHESIAIHVCKLASKAVDLGSFGVGAVLLDPQGSIVAEGHNEVFIDTFRSDLHAEMVVLNRFESEQGDATDLKSYTLVSSLDPCPMCTTRLILSGVGTVLHVAEDPDGGMADRMDTLPPSIRRIAVGLSHTRARAECSDELRDLAFRIFERNVAVLDKRLIERGGA